jgi:sugar phosphate isomerase/epimerase
VLTAAEAAGMLGARYLVIHPGPEHAEQQFGDERLRRLDYVAVSLSEIAARCEALGMTCLLENKLRHLLFGNTADMLWILGAMTSTNVGVCLDTGHAQLAGELDGAAQKLSRHLRLVHASDNAGQYDDHLPPGRGRIDWPSFLRLLKANAFRGSIVIEMAGLGNPDEILHCARQARQFLRRESWKLPWRPGVKIGVHRMHRLNS